jgi:hypothetical protein
MSVTDNKVEDEGEDETDDMDEFFGINDIPEDETEDIKVKKDIPEDETDDLKVSLNVEDIPEDEFEDIKALFDNNEFPGLDPIDVTDLS